MTAGAPALFCPPKKWMPAEWPHLRPEPPTLEFNPHEPPVRQSASWTCSCASLAWVMNALGVPAPTGGKWDEWDGVNELRRIAGYTAVMPSYGLAYATGVDLERVYNTYGFLVERLFRTDWIRLAYMADRTVGQLGGARWYHWSGLRGCAGPSFELANPAPTWKGVGDNMNAAEWDQWGGWNGVMIVGRI